MNTKAIMSKPIVLLFAVGVTLALLFTMHLLIRMAQPELDRSETFVMPRFVHVEEAEVINTIQAPEKPPEVQERPDIVEQDVRPQAKLSDVNINLKSTVSINKSNKIGLAPGDGEYLPIVKIAPVYPRRAAERCLEGYAIVGFTVTSNGSVRDPYVVESSSSLFDSSAKKAALKFKYKPRTVDGVPIEVPDVKNKITYQMDGCKR